MSFDYRRSIFDQCSSASRSSGRVEAGYRDNGPPGLRCEEFMPGIYAAYLLDPDGA